MRVSILRVLKFAFGGYFKFSFPANHLSLEWTRFPTCRAGVQEGQSGGLSRVPKIPNTEEGLYQSFRGKCQNGNIMLEMPKCGGGGATCLLLGSLNVELAEACLLLGSSNLSWLS